MGDLRERVGNFFHEHRTSVLNASVFVILAAHVLGNGAPAIAAPSYDDPALEGGQASLFFTNDDICVSYFLQTDEPPSYEPEPGTILLLGAGLMGLVGYASLRLMKK